MVFTPGERLAAGRTVTLVLQNFTGADATLCASGCTGRVVTDMNSTTPHTALAAGSWTLRTHSLVLTVASGQAIAAGDEAPPRPPRRVPARRCPLGSAPAVTPASANGSKRQLRPPCHAASRARLSGGGGAPQVVLAIEADAGITCPPADSDFTKQLRAGPGARGNSGGGAQPWAAVALFDSFALELVSEFPPVTAPRRGFVAQASPDPLWRRDVTSVVIADELDRPPSAGAHPAPPAPRKRGAAPGPRGANNFFRRAPARRDHARDAARGTRGQRREHRNRRLGLHGADSSGRAASCGGRGHAGRVRQWHRDCAASRTGRHVRQQPRARPRRRLVRLLRRGGAVGHARHPAVRVHGTRSLPRNGDTPHEAGRRRAVRRKPSGGVWPASKHPPGAAARRSRRLVPQEGREGVPALR
jgi:hypothetical protein